MLDTYLALREEASRGVPAAEAGIALCRRLTAALDEGVAALLPGGGRLALVAVGGYGRGEMCLHSDVDLMLLHGGSLPSGAERVFYPLWDAGLKVGHAVRGVREAAQAAREDLETLTALLDMRLVAGDADLFGELHHAIAELLRRGRVDVAGRLADQDRARRNREPYLLQDLDVKEGRGGLRALQGIHWDCRARELAGRGEQRPSPGPAYAQDTLLATRNALHAVAGKAFDTYAHDLHPSVASWLRVDGREWSRGVNLAVGAIDRAARGHWQPRAPAEHEPEDRPRWWGIVGRAGRRAAVAPAPAGAEAPRPFYAGSVLALAGRAASHGTGAAFDDEEKARIRAAMGPMWTAEDREGLLALLRAGGRGQDVFDDLDALGWAERAMPEWAHVRGLPQFALFHLHPVDAHLWRTAHEMALIARRDSPEPPLAGVAAELDSLDDALLAAFLHDIGKGFPGDHSEVGAKVARAFLRRAGFGPRTVATVERAIRHHLLLPTAATRRDLDDPAVIADVADAAADGRTLRVLYLLAVADSRATGPAVWSPWKGSLLLTLYERADDELRRRERAVHPPTPAFDPAPLIEAARGHAAEAVVRQHLAAMPAGYPDAWTVEEMSQHVRLMWPAPAADDVRLEVQTGAGADDVTLALEDRPGLLALTAGALALHNVSVLGGRFATRSDGVALQALHVADTLGVGADEERWTRVRRDVARALRGELDLEAALREKAHSYRSLAAAPRRRIAPRVVLDARASGRATLVEVHAEDRIGLLHTVARTLFDLGLDINVAKIDTLGREVVDVFYVRDLAGHPPRDPARLAAIERAVLDALAE